jgi:hypothetical protein
VLPANVTLDWKVITRYKQSSLFGLIISNEGKKFYNLAPCNIVSWCSHRQPLLPPLSNKFEQGWTKARSYGFVCKYQKNELDAVKNELDAIL